MKQSKVRDVQSSNSVAQAAFERGMAYSAARNNAKRNYAIEEYSEAIRLDPNFAAPYCYRGMQYLEKGRYDSAIDDLTAYLKLAPDDVEAYVWRAKGYKSKGRFNEAISDCTEAIKYDPNSDPAYNNRAAYYYMSGQYDDTIRDCTEAIKLNPDFDRPYFWRGKAYYEKQQYDEAIKDLTKASELGFLGNDEAEKLLSELQPADETDADTHAEEDVDIPSQDSLTEYAQKVLGENMVTIACGEFERNWCRCYDSADDAKEQVAKLTETIRHNPNDAEAYFERGELKHSLKAHRRLGKWEDALDDFSEAIRINPNHLRAYVCRGMIHRILERYDDAIYDFTEAIRCYKPVEDDEHESRSATRNLKEAYCNRGKSYYDKGLYDDAIKDFTNAAEIILYDEDEFYYYGRAKSYRAKGQWDKAIEDFCTAIKYALGDGFPKISPHLIDGYIEELSEAMEYVPNYAPAYYRRGKYYHYDRQYDNAIKDLTAAIKLDPNYAKAYFWRGKTYYSMERWDDAIREYTDALKIEPNYGAASYERWEAYKVNGAVHYERGETYKIMGQQDKAIIEYGEAILKLTPAVELIRDDKKHSLARWLLSWMLRCAYCERGEIYRSLGQYDKALNDLNEVLVISETDYNAFFGIGKVYYAQGLYDDAIWNFSEALENTCTVNYHLRYYFWRGKAYHAKGQLQDAYEDLTESIKCCSSGSCSDCEEYADEARKLLNLEPKQKGCCQ